MVDYFSWELCKIQDNKKVATDGREGFFECPIIRFATLEQTSYGNDE